MGELNADIQGRSLFTESSKNSIDSAEDNQHQSARTLPQFAVEPYDGFITPRQEISTYRPELLPPGYRESPLLVSANFKEALQIGDEALRTAVLSVYRNGDVEVIDTTSEGFKMDFRHHADGRYSVATPRREQSAACPADTWGPEGSERIIYAADGQVESVVTTQELCHTDWHEFRILPNGNYALPAYPVFWEEELTNGEQFPQPYRSMRSSAIQEVTPEGDIVFTWNSLNVIPIADVVSFPMEMREQYAHINSFDLDVARNEYAATLFKTSQLLFIDRATAEINGILGGLRNEYTFMDDPLNGPCGLHSVVVMPAEDDGLSRYLLFDNGREIYCAPEVTTRPYSRVVLYAIDHETKTATLEWSYVDPSETYAHFSGGVRTSGQGTYIIAWGADPKGRLDTQPSFTELLPDGTVVFESTLWFDYPAEGATDGPTVSSRPFIYRVYSLWGD